MIRRRWRTLRGMIPILGLSTSIKWGFYRYLTPNLFPRFKMHPKETLFPMTLRGGSSDIEVFQQIFIHRGYDSFPDTPDGGLIIDCGANFGCSSVFFLARFPKARIIAVEPDPDNFAILEYNMKPYGERVKLVRSGVWSHSTGLVISEEQYRDGRAWTKTVRPNRTDEKPQFQGVDIGSLLADSGMDRISILKIDIEGAEAVVFKENYQGWLDKVDNIAIELHGDSSFGDAHEIFFKAIANQGFEISEIGDLTICRRKA